jgi:hypothetical protein
MTVSEIKAVISELNRIDVKGETNLDILLGCIKFLKLKAREAEKAEMPPKITEDTPKEVDCNG